MQGKTNKFWLLMTFLLLAAVLLLCVFAATRGSIYIKPSGNPQYTVTNFFDALVAGDYPRAYACLNDYKTLGLETEPATEEAKLIYEALKNSYEYELLGDCAENKMEAVQKVKLRYLDVGKVEAEVAARIDSTLEELVAQRTNAQIYDSNGNYLPGLTDEVYRIALERVLEAPDACRGKSEFEVTIEYVEGQWLMRTNPSLLSAIAGGAA
ncbi:MAG: hypothetical protein J5927_05175 [Oscillospiraceae bacterium]|nr:hypothetical protein [Oscillospiraceae bacterium]